MGLSVRPKGHRWAVGGSGLAWWWHTESDTIDKVDRQILHLDTRIYLAATYRFATAPVLPMQIAAAARELDEAAAAIARDAAGRFDLGPVRTALSRLAASAESFDAAVAELSVTGADTAGDERRLAIAGRAQRAVVRDLIQTGYVGTSPFDHDPAVPQLALPALQDARELARLNPDAHAARMLVTRLVRRRNSVLHNLAHAVETLEGALGDLRGQ
jgi:hypothetical protein